MKQRHISLMLSVVTLFLSAGVLFVYGQQVPWTPPNCAFNDTRPECGVWAPVDTKPGNNQIKEAILGLNVLDLSTSSVPVSVILNDDGRIQTKSNNAYLWLGGGSANGQTLFSNSLNSIKFNTKGLILPKTNPGTGEEGMIYYDSTGDGKVKLYNKTGWTDIGTGSGGGDSFWVANPSGGIVYTGGDVTIGLDGEQWVYEPTGTEEQCTGGSGGIGPILPSLPINKAFAAKDCSSYLNSSMSCDSSSSSIDCTQSFYVASGSSDKTTRYDQYHKSGDSENSYYYKIFRLGKRIVESSAKITIPTISAKTASIKTLSAESMSVSGNVSLTNGKIRGTSTNNPFATGFVEGAVGNWTNDDHTVGNLPSGYDGSRCVTFMQGFRNEFAHGWDASLVDSADGKNILMGSLAVCWLGGAGDGVIHGSYAGDDGGPSDGILRCGYLCW